MVPIYDVALAIKTAITGIPGIILNGCLLFVMFSTEDLRSTGYMRFIINKTLGDFLACCGVVLLGIPTTLDPQTRSIPCTISAFVSTLAVVVSLYAEPALTLNRLISVRYRHIYKRIYTKRNVYGICAIVWILALVAAVPHLFTGAYHRAPGAPCALDTHVAPFWFTLLVNQLPPVIGLIISCYCNLAIYHTLRGHQNQPLDANQRTRLQRQRQMLWYIMAATFVPVGCQVPLFLLYGIKSYAVVPIWIIFGTVCIYTIASIANPLITFFMVQPVRAETVKKLRKIFGRHTVTVHPDRVWVINAGTTTRP